MFSEISFVVVLDCCCWMCRSKPLLCRAWKIQKEISNNDLRIYLKIVEKLVLKKRLQGKNARVTQNDFVQGQCRVISTKIQDMYEYF